MDLQPGLSNYTHGRERRVTFPLVRLGRGVEIFERLLLPLFQFRLALMRRLGGAGSGLNSSLLDEIAPAGMAVFGRLAGFVILSRGLCGALAPGNLDHATGLVGSNVVPDDGVGG